MLVQRDEERGRGGDGGEPLDGDGQLVPQPGLPGVLFLVQLLKLDKSRFELGGGLLLGGLQPREHCVHVH